jgi:UDP-glucose 4-epimerase
MSARRALVTGAAGFIGASLARRLLDEGHDVHVLVRPGSDGWRLRDIRGELNEHRADLRHPETVCRAVQATRPDWVFHLAAHGAYSWQTDTQGIFDSNALGTLHLLDACVERGFEAFVHAGSSSEYGLKDHAPSENEAPEPDSDYAVAKVTATMLCRQRAALHRLRVTTLRLYSVYGPWEDPRRLMPTLVAYGRRGELPPLVDPETARDFVHIEDVCEAFLLAARARVSAPGAIYNVGSGKQTTLREVVDAARKALDIAAEPSWGSHEARPWDTSVWVADPVKIARELDWRARWDLERGIKQLADWIGAHDELAGHYGALT